MAGLLDALSGLFGQSGPTPAADAPGFTEGVRDTLHRLGFPASFDFSELNRYPLGFAAIGRAAAGGAPSQTSALDPSWGALRGTIGNPNADVQNATTTLPGSGKPDDYSWLLRSGILPQAPQAAPINPALPPASGMAPFPGAPYNRASQDAPGFGREAAPLQAPPQFGLTPGPTFGVNTDSILPPNSTPTTNIPAQPAPGAGAAEPSLLNRVMGGLNENSNTLLALAGGFGGAPSFGTGLGRAAQLAIPASQLDQKQQIINQTMGALVKSGKIAPDMAALIANNPAALQQILPQILGTKTYTPEKLKGALGEEVPAVFNPATGTWMDASGKPMGAGAMGGNVSLLAPGVTSVDSSLQGWDYLKQYSPEVQGAVKAYMSGNVMPTGNPRQQTIASQAKMIAQKVASDIGEPSLADDALYPARRKMQADLASSSPNTMGGILSNGKSAFGHLATLSDKYVSLGNVGASALDFPGGQHIASIANVAGNVVAPSTSTTDKINGARDAALKYGQESTKFYAGTGGGEGERTAALRNNDPATSSAASQAGFLESERQLMVERLHQKEAQIRDTLGQQYLDKHPVVTPELQGQIARIDANIARLRGQAPAASAAAPSAPSAPAIQYATNPQTKQRIMLRPGSTQWEPAQ